MFRLLEGVADGDHIQFLRSSEEQNAAPVKEEFEARLDILETLIRDAWMLSLNAPSDGVVNHDLLPQLERISKRLDGRRPAGWISQIEEMREQLIVNIPEKPKLPRGNRSANCKSFCGDLVIAGPGIRQRRSLRLTSRLTRNRLRTKSNTRLPSRSLSRCFEDRAPGPGWFPKLAPITQTTLSLQQISSRFARSPATVMEVKP